MRPERPPTPAPELRVDTWIDANGEPLAQPLQLSDLGDGYKIIYCFQHWCPGCHSNGFPTLRRLQDKLEGAPVGFAVIQTVFEGADVNTFDKLRTDQQKFGLKMPFGHDVPPQGRRYPSFMEDYGTGGTPWFTVIDPEGNVVFSDFRLNAEALIEALAVDGADAKQR